MRWTRKAIMVLATGLAAVALVIGAGAAIAAGSTGSDSDLTRVAEGLRQKDAFGTAVAKELGTTAATLDAAVAAAAKSRIDAAEKAGSLSAANADLLREAVSSGDRLALHIAQAADVAKALGVTQATLDAAYAKVRKSTALARIDQAEKDERITKKVADELRARVAQATFPGFGDGGLGRGGPGHGGPGGFGHGDMGHGGFGPPPGAFGADGSSAPSGTSVGQAPAVVF